jgi:methionyl-tRNA synthetase
VRKDKDRCATVLNVCLQVVQGLAVLMVPYLPLKAQELWEMLGMKGLVEERSWREVTIPAEAGRILPKPHPLIRKLEVDDVTHKLGLPTMEELAEMEREEAAGPDCPADILDMVIARITSVEAHPDADKLWIMTADLGPMGERTLVAGLREHYTAEELQDADIVVVTNLAPAKLRGVLSEAMLLAAEDKDGTVSLLMPASDARPGDGLWSPIDRSEKGVVEFKRFLDLKLTVDSGNEHSGLFEQRGLEVADLVIVTPDGDGQRVLHTPTTVITLDRPVRPGSKVH